MKISFFFTETMSHFLRTLIVHLGYNGDMTVFEFIPDFYFKHITEKGFKIRHSYLSTRVTIDFTEIEQSLTISDELLDLISGINSSNTDELTAKQMIIDFIKSQF